MTYPPFSLRPLLFVLLASSALAQENELPPTHITASPPAAPTVTETSAQTLEQRQIRSFDDLGKRAEPGVNFNRSSESINIRGLEQSRVLTTIDGIRLPWLTDGARSQGPNGGAQGGLDTVDFNGLSRLDIVRGAGSAEAGSGALGGELQLFTLNPADLLGEGKDFGSLLKTDYDSADQSVGLNGALAARYQDSAYLLQVGGRRGHELDNRGNSGGFGSTRSKANPSDSEQHSLLVKVQQRLGEHELGLTGEYFERENAIDSRTNQNGLAGGYQLGQNQVTEVARRERLSLNWRFTDSGQSGLIDHAETTAYWQRLRRHDDQNGVRIASNPDTRSTIPDAVFIFGYGLPGNPYKIYSGFPNGPFGRNNQIEKEIWGFSGKLDKGFTLASTAQRVTLGAELYRVTTEQFSKGYDNCPTLKVPKAVITTFGAIFGCPMLHSNQADMPKSEGTHLAIYASDEIRLNPRVTLTPALRYDYYKEQPKSSGAFKSSAQPANGGTLKQSSDDKFSASLLGTFQLNEQTQLYAQIAQGFRAPDATELYMNYGGQGTYLVLGNPQLKLEQSTNFELGGQFGDDRLGGKVSLFDSRYKHFINSGVASAAELAAIGIDPTDYPLGVTRAQNLERVRIWGSEVSAHFGFADNLKVWGQAAFARGKDRDSGQYLNSVAPLTGLLGLSLEQEELGADLILRSAAARTKTASAADFKAPGYGVLDFSAYFQPKALGGVRLQAGLFNLFNKKYWNAISVPNGALAQPADYYSETGRSARLALVWQY